VTGSSSSRRCGTVLIVPNLRIASRTRRDPLSNAEIVKIGRIFVTDLPPVSHVSYPVDDGETVAVVVHGFAWSSSGESRTEADRCPGRL
jgi:hypothetical protein